ncbi:MAG TPA: carbon storage regulator [Gemmataceae bacterium]|nr:carbon storage regulator [Gemmataceae bacterium]
MLVLTRKLGEQVIIDGDITVTLLATDRGRVRLGIEAPSRVAILRAELERRSNREMESLQDLAKRASRKYASAHAELLLTT